MSGPNKEFDLDYDPMKVLRDLGIEIPDGTDINIIVKVANMASSSAAALGGNLSKEILTSVINHLNAGKKHC